MRPTRILPLLLLASLLSLARAGEAPSVAALIQQGDELDKQWKTAEALVVLLTAEKLEPRNPEILRRIATQLALSMVDVATSAEKRAIGEKALTYAKRAVELAPQDANAHIVMAVCCGRLAKHQPNREKIETSKLVKLHAETGLQLNPRSDLAHFVLGVWHYELANLGTVLRTIAGIVYGTIPAASNVEAERHFRRARELDPKRVGTVLELGRTVALDRNRKEEARALLEFAAKMPARDKDDPEMRQRAKAALAEL